MTDEAAIRPPGTSAPDPCTAGSCGDHGREGTIGVRGCEYAGDTVCACPFSASQEGKAFISSSEEAGKPVAGGLDCFSCLLLVGAAF